mmetsp:Transcript_63228/g.135836  ORF Transcript_63228/g.135836 Transcript_63228/m.135836 type:complete len:220 (+) Transcript_63228:2067-2726(+)
MSSLPGIVAWTNCLSWDTMIQASSYAKINMVGNPCCARALMPFAMPWMSIVQGTSPPCKEKYPSRTKPVFKTCATFPDSRQPLMYGNLLCRTISSRSGSFTWSQGQRLRQKSRRTAPRRNNSKGSVLGTRPCGTEAPSSCAPSSSPPPAAVANGSLILLRISGRLINRLTILAILKRSTFPWLTRLFTASSNILRPLEFVGNPSISNAVSCKGSSSSLI